MYVGVEQKLSINELCLKIQESSKEGTMSTIPLEANAGRSSYLSQQTLLEAHVPDPGAYAVLLWISAITDHLMKFAPH